MAIFNIGQHIFGSCSGLRLVHAHIHAKKYLGRSEAILTEQAWSIKDMVLFRGTACNPEGARSHLVRSGRQYQCRIWLTLHTRGARCIRDGLLF